MELAIVAGVGRTLLSAALAVVLVFDLAVEVASDPAVAPDSRYKSG